MSDIKAVEKNKKMLDFSDRWKRLSDNHHGLAGGR